MKKLLISQTITALILGTVLAGTTAMANDTIKTEPGSTTAKIDNSVNTASNYMGDSAVTAKVKSALVSWTLLMVRGLFPQLVIVKELWPEEPT